MKKRILLLVLSLTLCLCASACGKGGNGGNDGGKAPESSGQPDATEAVTQPEDTTEVDDGVIKVTFDGSGIREGIVAYMRSMAMVEWKPSQTFSLNGDHNTWGVDLNFTAGKSYRGLPYTRAFSGLDDFAQHISGGVYNGPCGDYNTMPGNNCSSSCDLSWRKYLVSDTEATYTYVPGYGNKTIVAVGDYEYIDKNRDTYKIIDKNDRDVMLEAFALCKPADAIVKWSDTKQAGHARMVCADAKVVRNAQSKINAGRSYITVVEQTNKLTTADGKGTTWLVDKVYSFAELLTDGYIPVTPVGLADGKVITPTVTLTDGNTAENIASTLMGTLETNCALSTVEMTVTDEKGEVAKSYTLEVEHGTTKLTLRKYSFNLDIKSLPAGKYVYKLTVNTPALGSAVLQELSFEK